MNLNNSFFIIAVIEILIVSGFGQNVHNRHPRPGPEARCKWVSAGICGALANALCPLGSNCRHTWLTQTAGICCRNRTDPPQGECTNGISDGSCGLFRPCKAGYSCQINHGHRPGTCCPGGEVRCPYGYDGVCGTMAGRGCRLGTTCRFIGNYPDAVGKCCRDRPLMHEGSCPPSSGRPGICVFDPNVNCLSHDECERGFLCCSEGCGKVCKRPVDIPIPVPY